MQGVAIPGLISPRYDLSEHVALVTGANHGIGAATARVLAACRARVILTYLRIQDEDETEMPSAYAENRRSGADVVVQQIESEGGEAKAIEADLALVETVPPLFDAAESKFGPVDILVNNASGWIADTFRPVDVDRVGRSLRLLTASTFGHVFEVDARAPALLIAEFSKRHIARGAKWGRIVGLTSGGPEGFPEEVSYGAAKAAQENLTMSAAVELAPYGVRANVVHPPVTDTGWVTPEVVRALEERNGITNIASPEQVAEVIAYLASDHAGLITGNVLRLR